MIQQHGGWVSVCLYVNEHETTLLVVVTWQSLLPFLCCCCVTDRAAAAAAKAAGHPVSVALLLQQLLPGLQKDVESAFHQASTTSAAPVVPVDIMSASAAAEGWQAAARSAAPLAPGTAGDAWASTAASSLSSPQYQKPVGLTALAPDYANVTGAMHISALHANMLHSSCCSNDQQSQCMLQPATAMMELLPPPPPPAAFEPSLDSTSGHQQRGCALDTSSTAAWMELQQWRQHLDSIMRSPGSTVTGAEVEALLQAELAAVLPEYGMPWPAARTQPARTDV